MIQALFPEGTRTEHCWGELRWTNALASVARYEGSAELVLARQGRRTSVRPQSQHRPCLTCRLRCSRCSRFSVFTILGKLPKCALATVRHVGSNRQRCMLDPVHIFRYCHQARHALLDCAVAASCYEYGQEPCTCPMRHAPVALIDCLCAPKNLQG